jgi:hypothetical protein
MVMSQLFGYVSLRAVGSVVVAWMVFSPDQIADRARSLGRQILS